MNCIFAKHRTHILEQVRFEKIQKTAASSPMYDCVSANDKPVFLVSGDQRRTMESELFKMIHARDLLLVEGVSHTFGSGMPIRDRRITRVNRPRAVAVLEAFTAPAETSLIAS
jgi:hypothetical protein